MDKPKRGLGSLIPTGDWELPAENTLEVEISQIRTNPYQPRLSLDNDQMRELVESVRAHGVLQPLLVRRNEDGYELVAGERRLQAARQAGLSHVPVVARECTDREMLELALVENLQRADLNPIERAKAYRKLQEEFGLDHEAVGAAVGKNRTSVANSLRLLSLPDKVQEDISEGKLTEGHGRAILQLGDNKDILQAADLVMKRSLSVRATERLVFRIAERRMPTMSEQPKSVDPNLADLESRLSVYLGTKTRITPGKTEAGRGWLTLEFYGIEDLNRISGLLLGE